MMAANGQVLYGSPSGRGILRNSAVRLSVCPSVTYYWQVQNRSSYKFQTCWGWV